jgi:hypothetical protein
MKSTTIFAASIIVTVLLILACLQWQPHLGWVGDRIGAEIFAIILAYGTYYGVHYKEGIADAKTQYNKDITAIKSGSFSTVSFWGWLIWWSVCFQIFVSFYIAGR